MTKSNRRQRTINAPVSCTGVGLHTGVESTITFKPAPVNHGIRFARTDINGSSAIKADIDHVVDISRGTTIGQNGVRYIQLNMLWLLYPVCELTMFSLN